MQLQTQVTHLHASLLRYDYTQTHPDQDVGSSPPQTKAQLKNRSERELNLVTHIQKLKELTSSNMGPHHEITLHLQKKNNNS